MAVSTAFFLSLILGDLKKNRDLYPVHHETLSLSFDVVSVSPNQIRAQISWIYA